MTQQILKSKTINYPKHIFFWVIALSGLYAGISNDSHTGYLFAVIFGGFTLLDILIYRRTTLQLNKKEFKVIRVMLIGTELENYSIPIEEIRAVNYEALKDEAYSLFHYFFLEILFPNGQSTFTILKMDGKKYEFHFNANEHEVRNFMEKLPDRVPNG